MDAVPSLPLSRRTSVLRILCSLLFCSAGGALALILSVAMWVTRSDLENLSTTPLLVAMIAIPVTCLIAFVVLAVRHPRTTITTGGIAACLGAILFLGTDQFATPKEFNLGPIATPDSSKFRTYMQMANGTDESITNLVPIPQNHSELFTSVAAAEWPTFLRDNRSRILDEWEADPVGQAWLDALAALPNDAAGILHPTPESPIIAFRPARAIISRRLAYAMLAAREGNTDDATTHLCIAIRASASLQRIGIGLVDEMVANILAKKSYECADYLLEQHQVLAPRRTALAEAILTSPCLEDLAKRTILGETQTLHGVLCRVADNDLADVYKPESASARLLFSAGRRFAFHPKRTEQELLDAYSDTLALVTARRLAETEAITDRFDIRSHWFSSLRNPVGHVMASTSFAALAKASANLWKCEDARLALLARLGQPATDDSPPPAP